MTAQSRPSPPNCHWWSNVFEMMPERCILPSNGHARQEPDCGRIGMAKKYRIKLSAEEQQELKALVSRGRAAAYKQTHARILLLSDEAREGGGMKDEEIAQSLQVGSATVERVRRRCVEEGIEAALDRKKQLRRRQKKLDGAAEAQLIALACGEPPAGRVRWTLRLLADQLVECKIVDSIHPETVRKTLKKTNSSPG